MRRYAFRTSWWRAAAGAKIMLTPDCRSSKFIDVLRMKCLKLHSIVLSDGLYYELVRSNFERADRSSVVRATKMCHTGLIQCSRFYQYLLFN